MKELKRVYKNRKIEIESRLNEFKDLWNKGNEKDIFSELVFCIFTPQSKAKLCWETVNNLKKKNLLLEGTSIQIERQLNKVRFKYKKALFVVRARELFIKNNKVNIKQKIKEFDNVFKLREWLVKNILGIGLKEASHFLRNIGFGKNIAILDRHILRNLKLFGVIKEIPKTLTKNIYYEIEDKMRNFSKKIDMQIDHLDLLFWCKETGEVFK